MIHKASNNNDPTFLYDWSCPIQNTVFSSEHHLKKNISEHVQRKVGDELQNHILPEMLQDKEKTGDRNSSSTNI